MTKPLQLIPRRHPDTLAVVAGAIGILALGAIVTAWLVL